MQPTRSAFRVTVAAQRLHCFPPISSERRRKPTAGVLKDVVLVKGFRKVEVDVTPVLDGLTLFHCHQQLHMDYGFKALFNVV